MNTYGLHSIHNGTFNLDWHSNYSYPREARDILVTAMRVHNLILNILGYIPGISLVSGCIRIATGLAMCVVTWLKGDREAKTGMIIGRWYDEALLTGATQVARGILEAFVPYGWIANGSLDFIATPFNFGQESQNSCCCAVCMGDGLQPHPEPAYPCGLFFLHIA